MNKRIRGLILPIPLLLAGQAAQALGLGELKVESALEQRLKGQIRLILNAGESLDKVQVKLAASEDYERVGLDPTLVPPTIKLAVRQGPQGPYIEITSSQPINEPIVSLLLEADWPKGRLLREYTLLLDPPSYAPVASVAPARLSQPESFDQIVQEEPEPEPVVAEPSPPPPQPAPETVAEPEPATEPVAEQEPLTREFPVEPPTPAADEVEVAAGSTLWSIASENRRPGVSVQQMMVAILRANPDAFLDGNMNLLKKGSVLRIPSADEASDVSKAEALAEVASQSQQWVRYQGKARDMVPVAYQTQASEEEPAPETVASNDYKLDLVPPRGESDVDTSGTDTGATTATENPDYAELALAREDLATLEQEKQELASRIQELESIVNDQQTVLQMKDADMAKLQQQLAELNEKRQQLEGSVKDVQNNIRDMSGTAAEATPETPPETGTETIAESETGLAQGDDQDVTDEQALAMNEAAETAEEPEVHDVWDQENELAEAVDGTENPEANEAGNATGADEENVTVPATVEEPVLITENPTGTTDTPVTSTTSSEGTAWWQKALDWITANPLYAAGAALLVLLLGLLPRILRKEDDELAESGTGSFLDSIGSVRDDPAVSEVAESAEADIDELLERIEQEPDNVDLLYEAALYYYGEDDQQNFENMAEELYGRLADPNHPKWQEIASLGQKIAPENALFGVGSLTDDHEAFEEPLTESEKASDQAQTLAEEPDQWQAPDETAEESVDGAEATAGDSEENDFSFDLDEFIPTASDSEKDEPDTGTVTEDSDADLSDALSDELDEVSDQVDTLEDTVAESLEDTLEEPLAAAEDAADELADDFESSLSDEAELDLSLDELENELNAVDLDDTGLNEEDIPVVDLTADLDLDSENSEELMDFDFGEENQPVSEETTESADTAGSTGEDNQDENLDEEAVDLGFNLDDIVPEGDAVATKLDLARAYYEMGDIEGARIMLDEVLEEGNAEQQAEARKLRDEIDGS